MNENKTAMGCIYAFLLVGMGYLVFIGFKSKDFWQFLYISLISVSVVIGLSLAFSGLLQIFVRNENSGCGTILGGIFNLFLAGTLLVYAIPALYVFISAGNYEMAVSGYWTNEPFKPFKVPVTNSQPLPTTSTPVPVQTLAPTVTETYTPVPTATALPTATAAPTPAPANTASPIFTPAPAGGGSAGSLQFWGISFPMVPLPGNFFLNSSGINLSFLLVCLVFLVAFWGIKAGEQGAVIGAQNSNLFHSYREPFARFFIWLIIFPIVALFLFIGNLTNIGDFVAVGKIKINPRPGVRNQE